jgi:two-component system sensor histidine kinase BaeS
MKLNVTKKIAFSVIGIVMICVVTMAWVTTQNLQRGFMQYLNEVQSQQLEEFSVILGNYYRKHGSFDSLRKNPRALNDLADSHGADDSYDTYFQPPPDQQRTRPFPPPDAEPTDRPPGPDPMREHRGPPPPHAKQPAMQHWLILGPRLSLVDASGDLIIGQPDAQREISASIKIDGKVVGTLSLSPMTRIADPNQTSFIRNQIRDIEWLAVALIIVAIIMATWLARHLLSPVAALRKVTQSIARGDLRARAPVINQDELGEFARHINSMAEALESNDQQRRKVLADISHELRTPLTVMRGEIEAFQDGIRQPDDAAIKSLHAEVLHLGNLIDDLYQLALADAGDLHYSKTELDLNELIREVTDRFLPRARAAQLDLSLQLPATPLQVLADSDRLVQVLNNLMENSVRYTNGPGRIVLTLRYFAGLAELTIEDSAPGVPRGMHEKLFERLFRNDPARTRQNGGSGLGLSICKVLILAHGGTIQAMQAALGGIKIVIHLPAKEGQKP